MLMDDNGWLGCDLLAGDEFGNDHGLLIDMGTLLHILEEEKEPDCVQSSPGDELSRNSSQDESAQDVGNHNNLKLQNGFQVDMLGRVSSYPSYDVETSGAGTGGSGDFYSNLEPTEQMCSPLHTCSVSFNDFLSQASGPCSPERIGISQLETLGFSTASSFSEGDGYCFLDHWDNIDFNVLEGKAGISFGHLGSQINPKCTLLVGELIINLPPKVIKLKQVEFTDE